MALGLTLSTLVILSCGGSDDDNNIIQRQASLTGAAERPNSVVTNGSGSALLTINDTQTQIFYTLTYTGLTNVQQAHIHVGDVNTAGGIILFLCTNVGTGANVAIGGGPLPTPQPCPQGTTVTITGTLTEQDLSPKPAQGVNTFADAITNLINGNTYTNVHTRDNPSGEIRGQDGP
jgi:hypothetical protein